MMDEKTKKKSQEISKKGIVGTRTFVRDFFNKFSEKITTQEELETLAEEFAKNACYLSKKEQCKIEESILLQAGKKIIFTEKNECNPKAVKENTIKELLLTSAIKSLWVTKFDCLNELKDLDIAILLTLYEKRNEKALEKREPTIQELEVKLNKNFKEIHESIYGKLRPKGLIIAEKRQGLGNRVFLSLTTIGKKVIPAAISLGREYEELCKDYGKILNKNKVD